jgi:hypothetical protein
VKQVYDATSRWIETHLCHFGLRRRRWSRMKGWGGPSDAALKRSQRQQV